MYLVTSSNQTRQPAYPPLPSLGGVSGVIQGRTPLLHQRAAQQGLQAVCSGLAFRAVVLPTEVEGEVHLLGVLLGKCLHAPGLLYSLSTTMQLYVKDNARAVRQLGTQCMGSIQTFRSHPRTTLAVAKQGCATICDITCVRQPLLQYIY